MVERIKFDPLGYLHIIDNVSIKILIHSQTILEPWYALKFSTKCCEYEDRISICKHLIDVRKLVKEKFIYLKCMFHIEEDGLINKFDDVGEN